MDGLQHGVLAHTEQQAIKGSQFSLFHICLMILKSYMHTTFFTNSYNLNK